MASYSSSLQGHILIWPYWITIWTLSKKKHYDHSNPPSHFSSSFTTLDLSLPHFVVQFGRRCFRLLSFRRKFCLFLSLFSVGSFSFDFTDKRDREHPVFVRATNFVVWILQTMSRGTGGGYDNQNTNFSPEARPSQLGMSLLISLPFMILTYCPVLFNSYRCSEILGQRVQNWFLSLFSSRIFRVWSLIDGRENLIVGFFLCFSILELLNHSSWSKKVACNLEISFSHIAGRYCNLDRQWIFSLRGQFAFILCLFSSF